MAKVKITEKDAQVMAEAVAKKVNDARIDESIGLIVKSVLNEKQETSVAKLVMEEIDNILSQNNDENVPQDEELEEDEIDEMEGMRDDVNEIQEYFDDLCEKGELENVSDKKKEMIRTKLEELFNLFDDDSMDQ